MHRREGERWGGAPVEGCVHQLSGQAAVVAVLVVAVPHVLGDDSENAAGPETDVGMAAHEAVAEHAQHHWAGRQGGRAKGGIAWARARVAHKCKA